MAVKRILQMNSKYGQRAPKVELVPL